MGERLDDKSGTVRQYFLILCLWLLCGDDTDDCKPYAIEVSEHSSIVKTVVAF